MRTLVYDLEGYPEQREPYTPEREQWLATVSEVSNLRVEDGGAAAETAPASVPAPSVSIDIHVEVSTAAEQPGDGDSL